MAYVIITLRIMPESVDTDLNAIEHQAGILINEHEAILNKVEREPIAFGLKALTITISRDEKKGSTDELEEALGKIKGVVSVAVIGVSRALG